jgi:hypothetical protein
MMFPKSLPSQGRLNRPFTRFVNHRPHRPQATGVAGLDGGTNRENRLWPILNVKHEPKSVQKTSLEQHFTAIREDSPRECLHAGIRFC